MPKPAGYSGTPLIRKLGIKEGNRLHPVNAPDHYWRLLGKLPPDVTTVGPRAKDVDLIHVFATRKADLTRRIPTLRRRIKPNGMIWVSWPKRASGVATDITEDTVREVAFANQLVDVKVCAVDEVWSGLKLVVRLKHRR